MHEYATLLRHKVLIDPPTYVSSTNVTCVVRGAWCVVRDALCLGELDSEGESMTIAQGGEGGSPTTNEKHNGLSGEKMVINLELKSIADIGQSAAALFFAVLVYKSLKFTSISIITPERLAWQVGIFSSS